MKTTNFSTLASLVLTVYGTDSVSFDSVANEYGKTFTVTLGNGKNVLVHRTLEGMYDSVMTVRQSKNLLAKVIPAIATMRSILVERNVPVAMSKLSRTQVWQLVKLGILSNGFAGRYNHPAYYTEYGIMLARQHEQAIIATL